MIRRGYMSQLDGLRFFAILGVMVAHNWQPGRGTWIFGRLWWGEFGVRLFFVLSGFLITGILLGGRRVGEVAPERRLHFVRQFYARRFLRIFPIYYLVLIAVVIANVTPARQIWPWLFTYTTNIYYWHHLHWTGHVGHLWTLAVEEQFYLVWPWLVLFLPRRWIMPLLLGFVCIAPLYRLYASFHYAADVASGTFTSCTLIVAVIDSLSIGAILAIAADADRDGQRLQRVLDRFVLPIGLVGFAALFALSPDGGFGLNVHISAALAQTAEALVFCWLVGSASRGFRGSFGRLLDWHPIAYLGKISYAIYIFHGLVPVAFAVAARHLGVGYTDAGIPNFLAVVVVTSVLAALSWELFEGPINGLKRFFPYDREGDQTTLTPLALPADARPVASAS
jgi:peptidoglycan/LPS O-acetylase OafA/YrhL